MLIDQYIIIQGITIDGQLFRPSDWAERLAGRLCSFVNRRMIYSPMLKPGIYEEARSVFIDKNLKEKEPALFWDIMNFAKMNKLRIINQTNQSID